MSTKLQFDLNEIKIKQNKFRELISDKKYKAVNRKLVIPIEGHSVNILKAQY